MKQDSGKNSGGPLSREGDGIYVRGAVIGRRERDLVLKGGAKAHVYSLVLVAGERTVEVEAWSDGGAPVDLPAVNVHAELRVWPRAYCAQGRAGWRLRLL
jgi:hypothetical protein